MNPLKSAVLLLTMSLLTACGNQVVEFPNDAGTTPPAGQDAGTDGGQDLAPTVTATDPVDQSPSVAITTDVSATFSEDMDPATVNASTFTLKQGATVIGGVVSYAANGRTATFTPAVPLGANQQFTATVTTGAKSVAGKALASNKTWTFTTAAVATPPMVTANTPLNLATYISINNRPTATFSTQMDASTITAQTFTLKQGTNAVQGSVSYDAPSRTARFSPNAPLALNTKYTATVTTGAKDSSGQPLALDYTWSFTTAACSQAPVVLGGSVGFAVLAGSTVTNTGPTAVTGDLGVSPGTAVTGFDPAPAGPGTVNGTQHVNDPTAATAEGDLTTAYNDAAGRTLCPISVEGNIGGMTLPPGLYKSNTSLAVSSGDLTLDAQGDSDAVWIFQMASTLTTTSGRQVILAGGAKASNIFWQVGSSATLGTTTSFQGTIMADQSITLNNGATLTGRVLARVGAVALDSNTVVKPAP